MRIDCTVLAFLLLFYPIGESSEDDIDLSDKRCWMVGLERPMMILTEETQKMIKQLQKRIETELQDLGNGELKEMEFEFNNKIEFAFHFRSNNTKEELMCISMK